MVSKRVDTNKGRHLELVLYVLADGPVFPLVNSFVISSPMALRFPSSKRRRCYFTGLEPGLIFKACSATSLGMPGMSEGFHAKMSLLARRKLTSALSYSEESVVPMCTTSPLEPLGSMRTSLARKTQPTTWGRVLLR